MNQTEITCQVFDSLENVFKCLKNQGYVQTDKFVLDDNYFCSYSISEAKRLSYAKLISRSILIREITDTTKEIQLIYKNKKLDKLGNVVKEEKYKTKIESGFEAKKILLSAGMNCWCHLVQDCCVFERDGNSLCLQNIKGLGLFVEIEENDGMRNLPSTQKIEDLKLFVHTLNIKIGSDYFCKKPYMFLHKN